MNRKPRVIILGGGPAGMAAAYYANKEGMDFLVIEADSSVGGNCRTFSHGEYYYDTGPHRIHDKIPEVTENLKEILGPDIQRVSSPSAIYSGGKKIDFPLTPFNLLRKLGPISFLKAGLSLLHSKIFALKGNDFRTYAINAYGRIIAEKFLINYSEKLWGTSAEELSPSISGKRMKGLDLRTFLKEITGTSKSKTEHIDGSFLYPRKGIGEIFQLLYDKIQQNILLSDPVKTIHTDRHQIRSIETASGRIIEGDVFINTLPVTIFLRSLKPELPDHFKGIFHKTRFRKILLTGIILRRNQFSKEASLYFPETRFPFTRIYEPKNRSLFMAPEGSTCILTESAFDQDEPIDQEKITDEIIKTLLKEDLIRKEEIARTFHHLLTFAYPVLTLEALDEFQRAEEYMGEFSNLYITGRSAEFRYLHIHDLFRNAGDIIRIIQQLHS